MKQSIGICSWSLNNDLSLVQQTMLDADVSHLHLEVAAIDAFREAIAQNGWTISCTMVGFPQEDYSTLDHIRETGGIMPDDCWATNRAIVLDAIVRTTEAGVGLLSFHAGFIDHNDAEGYQKFCVRIKELADAAQEKEVVLLMETGQETAQDLRSCLEELDHPALGVNFDPANMILYGKGDPIEAVKTLAPWIKHVHIKDATASNTAGEWGAEVPWGDGEVDGGMFLQTLDEIGFSGTLAIEREAGDARADDIKLAVKRLGES
ncbi:MAG: sugar phosphate isomerase/epimerase [Verrucomicrobia bacterium]|nr:sugar phosphate isomerase/epimerase [Verrucomicrobiota bacterium]